MKSVSVFRSRSPTSYPYRGSTYYGPGHQARRQFVTAKRTLLNSILNKIAVDAAMIELRHVKLDEDRRYEDDILDGVHTALNIRSNLDQTAIEFKIDLYRTILEQGHAVIVPSDYDEDTDEIIGFRVGVVREWKSRDALVELWNDNAGKHESLWFAKSEVAIIENPFYDILNSENSTLRQLVGKLADLDKMDKNMLSGKLDVIITVPHAIDKGRMKDQAKREVESLEEQLSRSQYGIGFVGNAEHITQLNRPVENNIMKQVEYLTDRLFTELAITPEIIKGTASEEEMTNYLNRTIEVVVANAAQALKSTFIRREKWYEEDIAYIRDNFKLIPVTKMAELVDKLTRNEVASPNEMRGVIGFKPSKQDGADELRNRNINQEGGLRTKDNPKKGDDQNEP